LLYCYSIYRRIDLLVESTRFTFLVRATAFITTNVSTTTTTEQTVLISSTVPVSINDTTTITTVTTAITTTVVKEVEAS
jgi:hypothetical protein